MKALFLTATLLLVGCGNSSSTPMDMGLMFDFTIKSNCGQPGDVGNNFGVGKFCQHESDCNGTPMPTLCTQLGDPNNYFCTIMCSNPDAGASECGDNAVCACDPSGRGCGCFPTSCIH
jgi:hypothetical protein